MSTPSVILSRRGGKLVCDVPAVDGWDGIEKLARYLEINFGGRPIERHDGPDARLWTVEIRGLRLDLQHEDPWGNLIASSSPESDELLREIAVDLTRRFRDV